MPKRSHWSFLIFLMPALTAHGQPCLVSNILTANPPAVNGTYACGQTVTFCFTVTEWASTNANWFHGAVATFGPGWDLSTLTPGPPPASCSGSGTWGWYTTVQGTAGTNIGPQGPGFFYDYAPGDGNPGNNFGDFCTGVVDWTFCWTISVLDGPACINGLGLGVSVNSLSDSETGSWGSAACGSDPIAISPPNVIQSCAVDAGSGGSVELCSSTGITDLFALLGGTPDAGGTWTDPTGALHSGMFDPASDLEGDHTYTVSSVSPPCSAQATISITVVDQPDAGEDVALAFCSTDAPVDLFDQIGGTPDPGGTWIDPNGDPYPGLFDPSMDVAGTYTYTIAASSPCIPSAAMVSISVAAGADAGTSGTLTICSTNAPTDLFPLLGGTPDPVGVWSTPGGSPFGGTFDPQLDAPGIYTYTVDVGAPCPAITSTVTMQVSMQPDAGDDAPPTVLCTADAPVNLLGLLGGSPDPGGTWTGPDGQTVPGVLDPSLALIGLYSYSLAAAPPCSAVEASIPIDIIQQPDPGSDATLVLCEASPTVDLFTVLAGTPDAGGTWTGPDGAPIPALFDPTSGASGIHTYTLAASAPCAAASSSVELTVTAQPFAGVDADLTVCSSGPSIDLFALLGPDAQVGGEWIAPDGNASTGSILPASAIMGSYVYAITATAPCINSSATVDLIIVQASSAGQDTAISLCTSDPASDLFAALGGDPDMGGTWVTPAGTGSNGTIDPASASEGSYTYSIPANGPCPATAATIDVAITTATGAGLDGTLTLCSTEASTFELLDALNGTPSSMGIWNDPSGQAHDGVLELANDIPGVYTYSVAGNGPCPSSSSSVTVSVVQALDPGSGGVIDLCEQGPVTDPMLWLSGTPAMGGLWTDPDGAIISIVDPADAQSGNYLYTLPGTGPCPDTQASVLVTVQSLPFPGDDASIEFCSGDPEVDLFLFLGNAQSGGTWYGPNGDATGVFDPASDPPGDYAYSIAGTGACSGNTVQSTLGVQVLPLPAPSISVDVTDGCAPLQVSLNAGVPGSPVSVEWDPGDGSSMIGSAIEQHTYDVPGVFTITAEVTDADGCTGTATFFNAVRVSAGPEAGFGITPTRISADDPLVGLFHVPEPDVSYEWSWDGLPWEVGTLMDLRPPSADAGVHVICLNATDEFGCTNASCLDLLITDRLTIYAPNAFTPDGDDINGLFLPSVTGLEAGSYSLKVFDRWGLEVFSSEDPGIGWNGSFDNNGAVLPQDVYVWRLWAKEAYTTERKEYFGTVTLVK